MNLVLTDTVAAALFLFGPLTLVIVVLNCVQAVALMRRGVASRRLAAGARALGLIFWVAACVCAVFSRWGFRDWVHLFWAAQVPLVGLFLGSGAWLCPLPPRGSTGTVAPPAPSRWGVGVVFAMLVTLGLLPVALQIALPEDRPGPRYAGEPIRGVTSVAAWGLGGALPEVLAPNPALRGGPPGRPPRPIGTLPRELTVPIAATHVAAWLCIAFSLTALCGLLLRAPPRRAAFYLLAPLALGAVMQLTGSELSRATGGVVDVALFQPGGARSGGIWECDPTVVRSYGPVLLAAFACAVVLCGVLLLLRARARSSTEAAR